jgi:hypothetical protein
MFDLVTSLRQQHGAGIECALRADRSAEPDTDNANGKTPGDPAGTAANPAAILPQAPVAPMGASLLDSDWPASRPSHRSLPPRRCGAAIGSSGGRRQILGLGYRLEQGTGSGSPEHIECLAAAKLQHVKVIPIVGGVDG